jgi:hypothetical protein
MSLPEHRLMRDALLEGLVEHRSCTHAARYLLVGMSARIRQRPPFSSLPVKCTNKVSPSAARRSHFSGDACVAHTSFPCFEAARAVRTPSTTTTQRTSLQSIREGSEILSKYKYFSL